MRWRKWGWREGEDDERKERGGGGERVPTLWVFCLY